MLRKLLGVIFNRWTLLALLLAALLAVLWIIGPLVAIGSWRPLETTRARWIASGVLLGLVVLVIVVQQVRARLGNRKVVEQLGAAAPAAAESADLTAVRQRFADALATLRSARFGAGEDGTGGAGGGVVPAAGGSPWQRLRHRLGGRYLYQLPWYLIIGAPGSGKTTALLNAGLKFPLAATHGEKAIRGVGGTRLCDWWFTDRAVLIDTAGRFTTQDSDAENDKATWGGFLALLKRSRPRQPLNGVLVTVSVADLVGKSSLERAQHAQAVRRRVQELHEQLRIRLPVYLMVTKCDLLAGFTEMFGALDKELRATPWGFTFPVAPAAYRERMDGEFDALLARLDQGLVDRLQAEPDLQRRARLYGFPNQFANLKGPLTEFTEQVFAPSPFEADPLLRGVYFISGTQEGTPIDRVLGALARRYRMEAAMLPPQRASGRSFFLQRLLTDVVFAEQHVAGTDRGWERRRGALAIAGYAAIGLVSAGLLAAWFVSHRQNAAFVAAVGERVEAVRKQLQATPNAATPELVPLLAALAATRDLAAASGDERQVPWTMGFGLYQGAKLDGAARGTYERMLGDAMLPRLALRIEQQLRVVEQPESLYESLKTYLMLYDPARFDAAALKDHVEAGWDAALGREISQEQRAELGAHLDALLARGAAVSPLPQDEALVRVTRDRLAAVPLPQRVYNRLRARGLGGEFPEVSAAGAGGPLVQSVFRRDSGAPLTRGVPGLYTYDGYHKGFQKVVGEVTRALADEQGWVLGVEAAPGQGLAESLASGGLTDGVRRLYLNDYRDQWKAYLADIKLLPLGSMAQTIERTRFLSGPDSPLLPMLRTFSRHTTLLAAQPGAVPQMGSKVEEALRSGEKAVRGALGVKPTTTGAPGERLESIVDEEFRNLRQQVTAPEGGKAPLEGVVARLGELQTLLVAIDQATKGGGQPPASPLPTELKVLAANAPEPLRSILDSLGSAASRVGLIQIRDNLSREVRATIGDFCAQAITGRYPFDPSSPRDVTLADFAALFGPGGRFEQMQAKLLPYVDTSAKVWRFRPVDGAALGSDVGTLPQFQRAQAIREAFFAAGGNVPGVRMTMKPVEMDATLREFLLDVDGQIVRYDHGPQMPVEVRWPGPRNSNVVRVSAQPAGAGLVNDGPWALFRLFDRVRLERGSVPEKFRVVFDVGGRRATFDVTTSSVRNPMQLPELRSFQCPNGL